MKSVLSIPIVIYFLFASACFQSRPSSGTLVVNDYKPTSSTYQIRQMMMSQNGKTLRNSTLANKPGPLTVYGEILVKQFAVDSVSLKLELTGNGEKLMNEVLGRFSLRKNKIGYALVSKDTDMGRLAADSLILEVYKADLRNGKMTRTIYNCVKMAK